MPELRRPVLGDAVSMENSASRRESTFVLSASGKGFQIAERGADGFAVPADHNQTGAVGEKIVAWVGGLIGMFARIAYEAVSRVRFLSGFAILVDCLHHMYRTAPRRCCIVRRGVKVF